MSSHAKYALYLATGLVVVLSSCTPARSIGEGQATSHIKDLKDDFRAGHSGKVRFQGVVTVENPNFGYFVVQDDTAGISVQPSAFWGGSLLGHRVAISGSLPTAVSGTDAISHATVSDLGPAPMPPAVAITAANVMTADAFDGKLISLTGTARFARVDSVSQLVLPVRVGLFEVSVRFIRDTYLDVDHLVDSEVRITGVASTGVDINGRLTDLTVFAADSNELELVRPAPDPASLPVRTVRDILDAPPQSLEHRVRLIGKIESSGEGEPLRFSDTSAIVSITNVEGIETKQTESLDVVAFPDNKDNGFSLTDIRPTSKLAKPVSGHTSSVVTSVAELHALNVEEASLKRPVDLDCIVTFYDPDWQLSFVADRTGGVYASLHGLQKFPNLRAGDHVRLSGVTGPGDFAPVVDNPRYQFLEHGKFPKPSAIPIETIFTGQADSQWVELEGIIQSIGFDANHPIAKLSYGSHHYKLVFPPSVVLNDDLVDQYVKVRGAAGTLFNGKRQVLGIQIFVQGLEQVELLGPADKTDAGQEPQITDIGKLLQFNPNEVQGHRVHVRGKVLASNPQGPTWIKDLSGAVAIREHNEIILQDGDIVDAAGFPVSGAFAVEIHDGVIHKRAAGPPVTPIDVTPERALLHELDGQLIRLDGWLVSEYQNGDEQALQLRNGKEIFTVRGIGNLPAYEIGALLRVSGICGIAAKKYRGVLVPSSLEVAVESPVSIEVIKTAPWLTQSRAWRALLLTSLLVALALIWVFMLRRRVARQTRLIEQKLLEVEKLREKAEAASASKSQFLANMSHEIRTPMNGILGMTEVAMQADSIEEQRECLSTIRSSGDALLSILNDLLDLSKIEAGKLEIHEAPFSLRELIHESGRVFAFGMKQKHLAFSTSVEESLPDLLIGDALRLRQILLNLLGNAVKFTEKGSIALSASGRQDGGRVHLRISVRDSGIGISPERQGRIFEAFRQADDSITRKYGGTGLGLSICMKLLSMMAGEIELESSVGQGSTFSVVLTLALVSDPSRRAGDERVHSSVRLALGPLKILLAEDNLVNQKVASKLLEKQGHQVRIVADGKQALAAFEREDFDLILMDVQMPEMDGIEATLNIRRLESKGRRTPIIAMTAQTMAGDRESCFAAGMDAFVSKPIRLAELWETIDAIVTPTPAAKS